MMKRFPLFLVVVFLLLVSCDDGVQKSYWENGKLKSELRYQDDKLNGECSWYFSSGKLWRRLSYNVGLKEGHSLRWHENGQLAEDAWYKNDQLDSLRLLYSEQGALVAEEHYVDGLLEGPCKKWFDDGQLFQDGQYSHGMMDGEWFLFYPEGQLAAKAHYENGKGKQVGYDEIGCKILEVSYLDNKKHGKEIRYSPHGEVISVTEYERGEIVSQQ